MSYSEVVRGGTMKPFIYALAIAAFWVMFIKFIVRPRLAELSPPTISSLNI